MNFAGKLGQTGIVKPDVKRFSVTQKVFLQLAKDLIEQRL
jgi:hypothetical protein